MIFIILSHDILILFYNEILIILLYIWFIIDLFINEISLKLKFNNEIFKKKLYNYNLLD